MSTATASTVTPALRETLLTVANAMPPSPGILAQLGHVILDPGADLSGIADMLKRDAALTARIIRIANSAVYNTGEPYASLEAALARVGMKEVYRMAGFAAVSQLSDQRLTHYGISGGLLRENALLCALVMEALARPMALDPRGAYTAGLLRSTGKIALDRMVLQIRPEGGELAEWERSVAGVDNCDAAGIVLHAWRFPAETVEAIRYHYRLDPEGPRLAQALNLAAGAAERGGCILPGESLYWERPAEKLAAIGVEEGDLDDALLQALEKFAQVRSAIG